MNLFIDTISNPCYICLFGKDREIQADISWNIQGNESSTLIPKIEEFLKDNNLEFSQLENIVLVNGPGSFTGVRTAVLVVNTMNFILQKNLTPINYFDLFDTFPIIKSSSRRDCFVKMGKDETIEIIENTELREKFIENSIQTVYGSANPELFSDIDIFDNINYHDIILNIQFDTKRQIEPLYIKKPNIC